MGTNRKPILLVKRPIKIEKQYLQEGSPLQCELNYRSGRDEAPLRKSINYASRLTKFILPLDINNKEVTSS